MSIKDKLRKAAGLFVIMPEQEEGAGSVYAAETGPEPDVAGLPEGDDIDARLAAMSQTMNSLRAGETPVAQPGRTIEQIVAESEGPNLDAIKVAAGDAPPPIKEDGALEFNDLYERAGLPQAAFTAEQTLEMIHSLPANLPMEVKRQTVHATVATMGKAIGATPETIVADASRKLAALASYSDDFTKQTASFVEAGEFEIQHLLAQVEEKRKGILAAREQQALVQRLCDVEADRLDDVLEFFSLDVGTSKYAANPSSAPSAPEAPART